MFHFLRSRNPSFSGRPGVGCFNPGTDVTGAPLGWIISPGLIHLERVFHLVRLATVPWTATLGCQGCCRWIGRVHASALWIGCVWFPRASGGISSRALAMTAAYDRRPGRTIDFFTFVASAAALLLVWGKQRGAGLPHWRIGFGIRAPRNWLSPLHICGSGGANQPAS